MNPQKFVHTKSIKFANINIMHNRWLKLYCLCKYFLLKILVLLEQIFHIIQNGRNYVSVCQKKIKYRFIVFLLSQFEPNLMGS